MFARRQAAEVRNVCQVQEVQRQIQGQVLLDLSRLVAALAALRGDDQQPQVGGQCERRHSEPEHASKCSNLDKVIAALNSKGQGLRTTRDARMLQLWQSGSLGPRVQVRATA